MCIFFNRLSWILEATGDEEWDRRALLTSWIFFSGFVFFRLLIGKELTLVRVIWAREDFFTRWRLIPGLSSNLWPEHQLKIQRVTRVNRSVSQSVSKQVSKQSASHPGTRGKSPLYWTSKQVIHHVQHAECISSHGGQLESREEHSVSERGPWVPVDLC